MNAIVKFRKCTLTDDELLARVDTRCDGMYEGPEAGKIPPRHIPARPDDDFDLLIGELILRYKEMKTGQQKVKHLLQIKPLLQNEETGVGSHHPEIKKLVVAWCDKIPYMHIWDKVKLADDITRCFNKITKQK